MAAAASKLAIAVAIIASGCHSEQNVIQLSERYGVCASLPAGASFNSRAPGPDYDLGTLKIKGITVEVVIGGQPRFSHSVIKKGMEATGGFRFLGAERSDGEDKILLGYERGDKEGPIFVMFSSTELDEADDVLTRSNLVVSCME